LTISGRTTKEKQELTAEQEKTRPGRHYIPNVDILEFPDHLESDGGYACGVSEKDVKGC